MQQSGQNGTKVRKTGSRDGILVVDKPADMTSASVVNRIKRLPGISKAGHTGTLDPFATGVLVCPVNRATRLSRFFLRGRKKYAAVLRLGIETDTMDKTGRIMAQHSFAGISGARIVEAAEGFTGRIRQVPPAFSALKHNGKPLYKYARDGKPVHKPAREVEIYSIRVTRIDLPHVGLEVSCSAGTYIRTLCADIGRVLGCGGHLSDLRRTESAGFTIEEAVPLSHLENAPPADLAGRILSMADALREIPAHVADSSLAGKIRFGRPITAADLGAALAAPEEASSPYMKIVDGTNRLLAVIEKKRDKNAYSYCCVFHSG